MIQQRTDGESRAYLQGLKAGTNLVLKTLDEGRTLDETKEGVKDTIAIMEALTPPEPSGKVSDLGVRAHRRPSTGL